MPIDALALQLATARQRYRALQRRAEHQPTEPAVTLRTLADVGTALEELRVAQDQMIESQRRMETLQQELTAQSARYWELFDEMPEPYFVTRSDTTITEVNLAAAELFNVSQRFLVGKPVSVFICEDRDRFLDETERVAREKATLDWSVTLRPRERAPLRVSIRVRGNGAHLRWLVRPSASGHE